MFSCLWQDHPRLWGSFQLPLLNAVSSVEWFLFLFFKAGMNSGFGSQQRTAFFVGRSSGRRSMWPMCFRVCFSIFHLMLWIRRELRTIWMLFLVLSIAIKRGSFFCSTDICRFCRSCSAFSLSQLSSMVLCGRPIGGRILRMLGGLWLAVF